MQEGNFENAGGEIQNFVPKIIVMGVGGAGCNAVNNMMIEGVEGVEFVAAQLRGHEGNEGFLVTGLLIHLIMPVNIPLWMVGLATAFAVVVGKEIFGGTGMNIFNPALLARAFIFFS